jgi:hypothetical protein
MTKKKRNLLVSIITATSICLLSFAGCAMDDNSSGSNPEVSFKDLGAGGATPLLTYQGDVFIGHNNYDSSGLIQYYDTGTGTINSTNITSMDVGDMVYHAGTDRIYFINSGAAYYIDVSGGDPSAWTAVQDGQLGTITGTSDMTIYNNEVYILGSPGWSAPYNNDLYIVATSDNSVIPIDLNSGAPTTDDCLTKIGVDTANNMLYFTDTVNGDIFNCNLNGSSIASVTTTNSGSTGNIYFDSGEAYVLAGLGAADMGVHMFDIASPQNPTTHFTNSAALSAQYMVFENSNKAYVTHYSGGVYYFDPSDQNSAFTIVYGTDPPDATGLQDILLEGSTLYVTLNNFPTNSELMIVKF